MLEYRRDHQNLRMSPRSGDAHILQWAKNLGDIEDHRLRAEFYHIQRELAQIIMKEVVGKTRCWGTLQKIKIFPTVSPRSIYEFI